LTSEDAIKGKAIASRQRALRGGSQRKEKAATYLVLAAAHDWTANTRFLASFRRVGIVPFSHRAQP
jgi:hypothetical protein